MLIGNVDKSPQAIYCFGILVVRINVKVIVKLCVLS